MRTEEAFLAEQLFMVVDKEGEEIPFKLNSAQEKLDDNLTGRDIVPKARQEGVSTYFLSRYTMICMKRRNTQAVIISHEAESTQRLLSRCLYFAETCKGAKPTIGRSSANVITFPKMNSTIYIGTAGSRKFGRGDTISHLHCSEYAYWPAPKETMSGLMQAVPMSGEIGIESTGNGVGNDYHQRCRRAAQGQSTFKLHFLPWHTFEEYTLEVSDKEALLILETLSENWGELRRSKDGDMVWVISDYLTPGQIAWRRMKLEEFNYDHRSFNQEYPMTLDDCFQSTQEGIFYRVNFEQTDRWIDVGDHLHVLDPHPLPGHIYIIGGDPSGGSGRDNAVASIWDVENGEQVAEWAWNRTEPDVFGEKIATLGEQFNWAYLVVESNNHGPVTLNEIRRADYPINLIYDMETASAGGFEDKSLMQLGFRTTSKTKPLMIGSLRRDLAEASMTVHSELLRDELSTFIETEKGKLEGDKECQDDRVMAAACASMGMTRAALQLTSHQAHNPRGVAPDPFSFEEIIGGFDRGSQERLIAPQHKGGHYEGAAAMQLRWNTSMVKDS